MTRKCIIKSISFILILNQSKGTYFKSSTASNYFYALKPYIEDLRDPEFLVGWSVIIDGEDKKVEI